MEARFEITFDDLMALQRNALKTTKSHKKKDGLVRS